MGFQGIRGTGIGPDSGLAAPLRGDFRTRQCDGMAGRHLPERGFYSWVGTYGLSCVALLGFGLGLGPSNKVCNPIRAHDPFRHWLPGLLTCKEDVGKGPSCPA